MRLRFRTVFAAAMAVATVAEAENAREMWDIFSDVGLFEGSVRKTEKSSNGGLLPQDQCSGVE